MVTQEGFPVTYEVFAGNTFEGHTLIPVIESFIKKHRVKNFTVVADAAMISSDNVQALKKAGIHYIVGARLGNLSEEIFKQMDQQLLRQDGRLTRISTDNGFLICSFSLTRFRKDKHEMEKQIARANVLLQKPSQNRKTKFVKAQNQKLELNQELITKTTKLLGVKGYYTNLTEDQVSSQTIIERYHDLYKIEQAFRISKHDLQTRPVFHFKEEPIRLHILICFMALAVSKCIELKTKTSLRAFLTQCKKITDARLLNKLTGKVITLRTSRPKDLTNKLIKLGLPH
jgi:transposase